MKPTLLCFLAAGTFLGATAQLIGAEVEPGFTPLFDGKTFDGWKPADVNKETWKLEDGAFVTRGKTCHLFYVGDQQPFKNFHLKVDVMTDHNANGGIYFHTKYQPDGWPRAGFECQHAGRRRLSTEAERGHLRLAGSRLGERRPLQEHPGQAPRLTWLTLPAPVSA